MTRIASKTGLIWTLLDLLAVSALVYLIAPWEWVGVAGRQAFFAAVSLLIVRLVWRSRHLPWRSSPPLTGRALGAFAHAVTLLLLAVVAWNLL